ncbi:HlyD family efflux transporter periplasmic adaptor subunit [bacterium]|nr:HlyD family efflux transporter periplasmic adaptor subunit [bacterium]
MSTTPSKTGWIYAGLFCVVLVLVILANQQPWFPATTSKPVETKASEKPAKTSHPVTESQLNTIELTEDAVRRLGLEFATVEERMMLRTRPYGADLVLPTGATVIVSAPLAGTLKPVDEAAAFQVGQRVTEGAPLLKLMPLLSPERAVLTPAERIRFAEAKNALAQSQIDADGLFQQATVQVEAAQIALERAERLLQEKAGTVRAVDEAQAQLQLAEKTLGAARIRKKQVDSVQFDEEAGTLEAIPITSPLTGILRATPVRPGEIVAPGSPLFEVMNGDMLWVKVPIYVGDLEEIDPSKPARLTLLSGRHADDDILVKPAALPPTAIPLAAAVDVYYELPNPESKYQPGQRVSAHLTLHGEARQLALPWSAVIHDIYGGQWIYEQTAERQFVRRRVEIGWIDGEWAAVTRGVRPGMKVITAGAAEIAGTEFGFAK